MRSRCTSTTPGGRRWPTSWPAWRKAWRWWTPRSPARADAPTRAARAATSPPRTWSTCCTAWASAPAWTWSCWPRPGAGCPPCSGGRRRAGPAWRWRQEPNRADDMDTRRPPEAPPTPPAGDGTARIIAALEAASRAPSLPEATRQLMAQACEALRAASTEAESARMHYHALFDAVPAPVSILDENGIVLDLNKAGVAAYRRSRDEIVGQSIEVLNPDLPKDHLKPVWEAINRGETYVVEVTNMRADGSRFPVEVHTAGFEHNGRRCLVAVARDLSARRDAERRYGQLLEVIDRGILVLDAEGRPVQVNAAGMRILGADEHQDFHEYLHWRSWSVVDETGRGIPFEELPHMRALRTGKPTDDMVLGLYHRPERRLRWLSVSTVPLFAP